MGKNWLNVFPRLEFRPRSGDISKMVVSAELPVENDPQCWTSGWKRLPMLDILIKSHYLCWTSSWKQLPMLNFWLEAITIAGILEFLTHAVILVGSINTCRNSDWKLLLILDFLLKPITNGGPLGWKQSPVLEFWLESLTHAGILVGSINTCGYSSWKLLLMLDFQSKKY